jgi:hypothetical protein
MNEPVELGKYFKTGQLVKFKVVQVNLEKNQLTTESQDLLE